VTTTLERLAAALSDRYRIERELGQGGMATVYLAQDLKHDRQVAIKVLKPELAAVLGAERFVVEIKTTAALQHPHILPLFDSGTADGFLFYVMPYIDGETLRAKLDRETQLGVDEAVKITVAIADALDHAHRHGVIHRDIKPENILLHEGRPMVADFGIALAVSAAAGGRMTETGLSLGTPHYMSPEQATAEKEISARSDVYSLASVLYEMLAGQPPHLGGSAQQIIMKIVTDTARPLGELRKAVPPNVAAAVAKALEKLPADRFESARAFAAALGDPAFRGTTAHGHLAGTTTDRVPRAAWLGGAALVLALGAAIGFMLKPATPPSEAVVRFRVPVPEGTQLNVAGFTGNAFAISPDGQWLALVARPARDAATQIYLRRLDRLEESVVAGSSGADAPFFSPDSRELGFVAGDGRLRRVAVAGGPVTAISDRPADPRMQPAWADDGQIYFRGPDFQMFSIRESGGESRQLSDTALVMGTVGGALPSVLSFPVPLPGGKRILLSECVAGILRGNGNCNGRLVLMDVATRKTTPLEVPSSRGLYLPGYLLLVNQSGELSAVEFDAASGAIRGEPVALLGGLGDDILQRPQVAVSGTGTLVFLDGEEVDDRVIVQVERRGAERTVVATPGKYLWPRLSPDGTRIMTLVGGLRSGAQIFIHDNRTGAMSPITFAGSNQRASWSPDGQRIAFSSSRDSATNVWIVAADGSAPPQPIAAGRDVQQHTETSWSPDGRWIIVDGLADQGPNAGLDDVYALAVSGDSALRPVVATGANEQAGVVSPDGQWIAYVSDDAGQPHVYVQPFLRLGGRALVSLGAAIEPIWTSANELVYSSVPTDSVIAARLTFGEAIGIVRTPLFSRGLYSPGSSSWRAFDVSRDGQTFLFTRSVARARLWEPVVVVNWIAEVRAAFAARRGTG